MEIFKGNQGSGFKKKFLLAVRDFSNKLAHYIHFLSFWGKAIAFVTI